MSPLRAFLMLRNSEGAWDVQVFRDLESVVSAWTRRQDANATGVVHVGFDRDRTSLFDDIAIKYPGYLLLTVSARYALPRSFASTDFSVGTVEGVPIFLGTLGWGYDATHLAPEERAADERSFAGWVDLFARQSPHCSSQLLDACIYDEASYLELEAQLPASLRAEMGVFRFRQLIGPNSGDPCAFARAAPPWLREIEFKNLPITVRLANVFNDIGVSRVSDLDRLSAEHLLRVRNFGRKSMNDLLFVLDRALRASPTDGPPRLETFSAPLLISVRQTLLSYPERDREILTSRMGLDGKPQTLAEIGARLGVTRERVRQLENKALTKLIRTEVWDDLLSAKLRKLLQGRTHPLPVLGIEAVDPWFSGVAEHVSAISYLLGNVAGAEVSLVSVDGVTYLALITQDQWDATVSKAKSLLASGVDKDWSKEYCRILVCGLLPTTASEFQSLLWEKASAYCVFVVSGNHEILCSYGRGVEQIVEAVLEESDRPLHYAEIAQRAEQRSGRSVDVRRAHHAAAEVGFLFSRGTFGTRRHLRLDEGEMSALAEFAEELVLDGETDRQWHCNEILGLLGERLGHERLQGVDQYHLDIALKERGTLRNFGRLVWSQQAAESTGARIEIREAAIATLQSAGRPLRANEIRQRLCAVRGIGQHFSLMASDPLIRIGPSLWGLNDRDCVIKRRAQPSFLAILLETLEARGSGIHLSELSEDLFGQSAVSPDEVFALAVLDERFRVSVGQYLYLREWGEPRRATVFAAVRTVLANSVSPMAFEDIVYLAQQRVGRSVSRGLISGALQRLGAKLAGASMWLPPDLELNDQPDFSETSELNISTGTS